MVINTIAELNRRIKKHVMNTCKKRSAGASLRSSCVIWPVAWLSTFTGSAAVVDK